jgi:uncharacterized protein YndB with AHSA1/START domain
VAERHENRQLGLTFMSDYTIEREILIDAPTEVVWQTITEPDQIVQWFADRVELDLRPGGHGKFVFDDKATKQQTAAPLIVEVVERPHRFAFRWSHPDGATPAPDNSILVTFTLAAEGPARTRLRVVETGLDEVAWTDEQKSGYVEDHNHGWSVHIGRLGVLLGTAEG